jgi:hypothetical protein
MYFSYFLGWPDDLMVFHEVFEEIALQHTGQEIKTSLLSGFKKKKNSTAKEGYDGTDKLVSFQESLSAVEITWTKKKKLKSIKCQ